MWPFSRPDAEKLGRRIRHMDASLRTSFSNVRRDTTDLGQWIRHLQQNAERQQAEFHAQQAELRAQQSRLSAESQSKHARFQEQMQAMTAEIAALNEELAAMPKTPEDIRRIIDQYYSYEALIGRIKYIEQRVEELILRGIRPMPMERGQTPLPTMTSVQQVPMQELEIIKQKLAALEQKKHSLKEKLIKRITRNSKQYVKGIILSYIRKYENVAALQLKEMMVDDQQLCSKSSFYRLMEELEQLDDVGVVREGKEKRYFMKAVKRH